MEQLGMQYGAFPPMIPESQYQGGARVSTQGANPQHQEQRQWIDDAGFYHFIDDVSSTEQIQPRFTDNNSNQQTMFGGASRSIPETDTRQQQASTDPFEFTFNSRPGETDAEFWARVGAGPGENDLERTAAEATEQNIQHLHIQHFGDVPAVNASGVPGPSAATMANVLSNHHMHAVPTVAQGIQTHGHDAVWSNPAHPTAGHAVTQPAERAQLHPRMDSLSMAPPRHVTAPQRPMMGPPAPAMPPQAPKFFPQAQQVSSVPAIGQMPAPHPFSVPLEVQPVKLRVKQSAAPKDFADMHASIMHPGLKREVQGTHAELLRRYPELRLAIEARHSAWRRGGVPQPYFVPHKYRRKGEKMVSIKSKKSANSKLRGRHPTGNVIQTGTSSQLFDTPAPSPLASYVSTPQSTAYGTPLQLSDMPDEDAGEFGVELDNRPFDIEHESIDAALEYIERPPADDCEKLEIEDDDWEDLVDFSDEFKSLCQKLFEALSRPGGAVPDKFDEEQKTDYAIKHDVVHKQVLDLLKTPEQRREAKARIIKAMHEVVRTHEVGIPKATLHDTIKARGYKIDDTSTCKQRAQKVISAATTSKYVARDILKSDNLSQIAQSPDEYLKKKFTNTSGNMKRGEKLKSYTAAQRNESVPATPVANSSPLPTGVVKSAVATPTANPSGMYQFQGNVPDANTPFDFNFRAPVLEPPKTMPFQDEQGPDTSPIAQANLRKRTRGVVEVDLGDEQRYEKAARFDESAL